MGILFMSLTFTLTSFTCTVQFVGYYWLQQVMENILPIIGMLSAAFVSLFSCIALVFIKIPKWGWLNSVKVTMGFLELAAAFKFLSNSDLYGNGIFSQEK